MLKPTASCSQRYGGQRSRRSLFLLDLPARGASRVEATSIKLDEFSVTRNGSALSDDSVNRAQP
jgi:hypothetical protein